MILFWNNKYYSGLVDKSNTQEIFHPIPAYCHVINYMVGLVFMSSFFIGVGLNPFIVRFNWSKRQSSVSLLFVITACESSLVVCANLYLIYGRQNNWGGVGNLFYST